MKHWLLEQDIKLRLEAAIAGGFTPSAEQQSSFMASLVSAKDGSSASGSKTGVIQVNGVLTEKPDFMAFLFGGGNTTYAGIIDQLVAMEASSDIEDITMEINSPGGTVAGLFEVFSVMEKISKPITAKVTGMAASAAFGLATQADTIEASSIASMLGSVGVVQSFHIDKEVIDVTSTDAPNKRLDASTEEGKTQIVSQLDDIHALFAGAIAQGRGTTVKDVNANFGRGGIVLAQEAVDLGMIDCICDDSFTIDASSKAADAGFQPQSKEKPMDLNELKNGHPALYAEVLKLGAIGEKDRVCAHLVFGMAGNCMDVAAEAIKAGTEMTQTLSAEYTIAAGNVASQNLRSEGDVEASEALEGAAESNADLEVEAADKAAADLFAEKFGV